MSILLKYGPQSVHCYEDDEMDVAKAKQAEIGGELYFPKSMIREPSNADELASTINGLPPWLRQYIHDLATRCDPAGDVRDLFMARQANEALQRKIQRLEEKKDNDTFQSLESI